MSNVIFGRNVFPLQKERHQKHCLRALCKEDVSEKVKGFGKLPAWRSRGQTRKQWKGLCNLTDTAGCPRPCFISVKVSREGLSSPGRVTVMRL